MSEIDVAVMLADVSGSTALYEQVGNVEALHRVSACLDRLREIIDAHGGQFISSKGDDVLSIFTDPNAALDVGMAMFEITSGGTLSLHAGIDFGPVIRARDDVFGDAVNVAARLSGVATAGEVLCTQDFHDKLDRDRRAMLRFFGPRHFKGKADQCNVYLFSDAAPGQATEIAFAAPRVRSAGLTERVTGTVAALRFAKETFVCSTQNPVTIGRAPDCDLVIPMPWVSRQHATIEVRDDKVYISDRSSAGTFVRFDGHPPVHVSREIMLLPRSCFLSPARAPGEAGVQEISCEVLSEEA